MPLADDFYHAFEERFRGSRQLIKQRLQVYLPYVEPLKKLFDPCEVLDVGCGRGEWLELLLEVGFQPRGVDLDKGMLAACLDLGLPAEQADALATLKSLPDESLAVVSGFHIAEHLPFPDLMTLVAEALRVLRPAGLLILETPNPENLTVGSDSFYSDPTHERPIPSALLAFLADYAGFARSKVLGLQESPSLHSDEPRLLDVLRGVSPDYAVIAQKQAEADRLELFDTAFAHEHGLSLETLANRFEEGWLKRSAETAADVDTLRKQLGRFQSRMTALAEVVRHQDRRAVVESLHTAVHAQELLLNEQMQQVQKMRVSIQYWQQLAEARDAQIRTLLTSSSWKMTAPLRQLRQLVPTSLINTSGRLLRKLMRPAIFLMLRIMFSRARLRRLLVSVVANRPALSAHLRLFAERNGLAQAAELDEMLGHAKPHMAATRDHPVAAELTVRGRAIYRSIQKNIGG
jgi:O-antigen chain-terminating methyltransferase